MPSSRVNCWLVSLPSRCWHSPTRAEDASHFRNSAVSEVGLTRCGAAVPKVTILRCSMGDGRADVSRRDPAHRHELLTARNVTVCPGRFRLEAAVGLCWSFGVRMQPRRWVCRRIDPCVQDCRLEDRGSRWARQQVNEKQGGPMKASVGRCTNVTSAC